MGKHDVTDKDIWDDGYKTGYNTGIRDALWRVENTHVIHGDHLAAYTAPSTDAGILARAVKRLLK